MGNMNNPLFGDTVVSDSERLIEGQGTPDAAWQAWGGIDALPPLDVATLVPPGRRAVIVAPHPDDEVLACGGLLQLLAAQGTRTVLLAVTDGDASHPGSTHVSPQELARIRPRETEAALRALAADGGVGPQPALPQPYPQLIRARLPDGAVGAHAGELQSLLEQLLRPDDVVFVTWRQDGHPDHEACGHAAAMAARLARATLVEMPVWTWHWAALAQRAEQVLATDMSAEAVRLTQQRMQREAPSDAARVTVLQQQLPQQWPEAAPFDLIVVSEMAYYLPEHDVLQLRERCVESLAPNGTLVMCHWRRPFADRQMDSADIHALFDQVPDLYRIMQHAEDDFLLDTWSRNPSSVAQLEGLVS